MVTVSSNVAGTATGIVYTYWWSRPGTIIVNSTVTANLGRSYFTVSFALNVLLTSMIVIRLILHKRNIRNAMGALAGAGQLYGAIITILVESSALYALSFLLFFVPWAVNSWVEDTFWSVLIESQVRAAFCFTLSHCNLGTMVSNRGDDQVIASFLIVRRVACRSALKSEAIVSRHPGAIYRRNLGESSGGSETLVDDNPMGSTDEQGEIGRSGLGGAGVEITVEKFTS